MYGGGFMEEEEMGFGVGGEVEKIEDEYVRVGCFCL